MKTPDSSPFGGIEKNPRFSSTNAAKYLGVEPQSLTAARCTGRFKIPYFKINKKVIYLQSDLDAYLIAARVDTPES